jgi:hypothetical protein
MAEPYIHHPVFRRNFVIALIATGVFYAGDRAVGGYENVPQIGDQASKSYQGLKSILAPDDQLAAETNIIGSSMTTCLNGASFGTERVRRLSTNPDTFQVYVRKMGADALDAASVEACITGQTGLAVTVKEAVVK